MGWQTLLVETPPDDPTVVTLAELKAHARIDVDADDDMLTGLERAASNLVERYTRRTLLLSTLVWTSDRFPYGAEPLYLRRPPMVAVASIEYTDSAGDVQAMAAEDYQVGLDGRLPFAKPTPGTSWPGTDRTVGAAKVTWTAGWATRAEVPQALKLAVKQLVSHWYENAEPMLVGQGLTSQRLPFQVQALCNSWRVPEVR